MAAPSPVRRRIADEPSSETRARFGLRLQLSLVMLLSALTMVLLSGAAGALLNLIGDAPEQLELAETERALNDLHALHGRVLVDDMDSVQLDQGLAAAVRGEVEVGAEDVAEYRTAALSWLETRGTAHSERPFGPLMHAHQQLTSPLVTRVAWVQPPWVANALPLVRGAWIWSLIMTTVTLVSAVGLHFWLTRPVIALSDGALRVAGGELGAPLPAPAGPPEVSGLIRAVGAMRDRLLASIQELDQRSAREATILGHMPDGVLLADPDGQVLYSNNEMRRLLVRSAGGVPTVTDLLVVVPELADRQLDEIDPEGLLVSRAAADGRPIWFRVMVKSVGGTPSPGEPALVVVVRDQTAQQELETLKQDFLSVVTHELRTPLTSIEGYARLMARGKGGTLSPRHEEFVGTILGQADALRTMVDNLLDVSRLESGTLPIDARPESVRELIKRAADAFAGAAESAGLVFGSSTVEVEGLVTMVDRVRLGQVLGNLLGNAAKFTAKGGMIDLSARPVGRDWVEFEVRDTGRGIPPGSLPRLFEKFYQVEQADTRNAGGAGLGLYITRQLVEAMGGTIRARSTVGEGSRFIVRMPLATPNAVAQGES